MQTPGAKANLPMRYRTHWKQRGGFFLVLGEGIDPQRLYGESSKISGYLEYDGQLGFGMGPYTFFQNGKLEPYNP